MPFIEVSRGGPETEIPDGVYSVTLVDIKGPRVVMAQRGPRAGTEVALLDWTFAIDDGLLTNTQVEASTSTASGPKSKLYAYLTALHGGKSPAAGTGFEVGDLAGRQGIATIRTGDDGWPRIENLSAKPTNLNPGQQPAAPVAAAPQSARAAVADGGSNLPF